MRTLFPLAALLPLALAACAGSSKPPEATGAQAAAAGSPLTQALSREYNMLADSEYNQVDWSNTRVFRDKAKVAASGSVPAPEDPTKRGVGTGFQLHPDVDIGKEQRGEAIQGRERLLGALSGGAPQRNPQAAARAQVAYDCWVEQLDEGWQRNDIERCRSAFNTAMAELEARPVAQAPTGERLSVFFAHNSAQLTDQSRQALAQVATDMKQRPNERVRVAGHTDRTGSEAYNDQLSAERAQAVKQDLVAEGVPADRISTKALGERDPAVPTPDGVAQPRNRRTVVDFD